MVIVVVYKANGCEFIILIARSSSWLKNILEMYVIYIWIVFAYCPQDRVYHASYYILLVTGVAAMRLQLQKGHFDVIKWKLFPRYWPFVRGIHRSPVHSPTKARDAELWCFLWSAPE